jgi:hypothetical protein
MPLFRSRDGEAGRGRPSADEEAQEEDGREAERPWLANHVIVKIIDKKLRGGRCAPDQPYRETNASSGSVRPASHALFVVLVMWRLSSPSSAHDNPKHQVRSDVEHFQSANMKHVIAVHSVAQSVACPSYHYVPPRMRLKQRTPSMTHP